MEGQDGEKEVKGSSRSTYPTKSKAKNETEEQGGGNSCGASACGLWGNNVFSAPPYFCFLLVVLLVFFSLPYIRFSPSCH